MYKIDREKKAEKFQFQLDFCLFLLTESAEKNCCLFFFIIFIGIETSNAIKGKCLSLGII